MSNVFIENATLQNIANAIRNKTGKTETMLPAEMPAEIESIETGGGYEQGYEDGKNSVIPFERYADTITFNNLNLFGKESVLFDLDNATSLAYFYSPVYENNTVKHITINCPKKISSLRSAFNGTSTYDRTLEHITLNVDTSNCSWWIDVFCRMQALKIIDGEPLNPINVNGNGFARITQNSNNIEEIRFVKESIKQSISFDNCANLSDLSRQSIIDGLADLTGQTEQTLTVHKTVGEKLTDEQKATITAKNWGLVLK